MWTASDEVLSELAKNQIRQLELISKETEISQSFVKRIHRCYPVYETGYKEHLDIITTYLKKITDLTLIGRYGSFKYNNQDHSILMGLLAAENIINGKEIHDLWAINTDSDYQEDAVVKVVLIG